MKYLGRLVFFLRPVVKQSLISMLMGLATIAAGVGMLSTSAWLIASAALHPSIADLEVAIVGVRFFGISRGVFRYAERLISHSVNLKVLSEIRVWFYRSIEPLAPARLQRTSSGDLLQRAMGDIETLENFYVRVVMPVIVALVAGAAASWFAGTIFPPLSWILATGLAVNGVLLPALVLITSRHNAGILVRSRAEASEGMVEFVQGLGDLQIFGADQAALQQVLAKSDVHTRLEYRNTVQNSLFESLALLIANLTAFAGIWLLVTPVNNSDVTGVSLAVAALLMIASFEATAPLPLAARQLNACLEAARRIFELAETRKEFSEQTHSVIPLQKPSRLMLQNVFFTYETDQIQALKDLSFTLEKGKKIVIVGASGAGKSSIVNLILGFWQPQHGTISLEGQEIGQLEADWLHRQFGVISQTTFVFNESLRDNLLLAKPGANEKELIIAISAAGLGDWFENLPGGLDAYLGEQGVFLSAGERQRLAAARILLQEPPFLLLDEPTSHLDPITGNELIQQIMLQNPDAGILYITHDLIHLDQMDECILLEEGKICEQGTMQELIQAGGKFARLVEIQKNRLNGE